MYKGIVLILTACFIWGLIFVIPNFMEGFTAIEVALGRYLFYGIISSFFLIQARLQGTCRYSKAVWLKALYFSLVSTIGYYTFLVMALRYSTPAICALTLGIAPITIAFYGNWVQKESSYKSLLIPSIMIIIGLLIINAPHLHENKDLSSYLIGVGCSFCALFCWTWYAVANAHLLKNNPEITSGDWSTLVGVATLFWVALFSLLIVMFFSEEVEIDKYLTASPMLTTFLAGCAILGVLCSWVGAYLWNCASHYVPVSLAGQLMVFETIFGLLFVYAIEQQLPPLLECLGIALFLVAIAYGIHSSSKLTTQNVA